MAKTIAKRLEQEEWYKSLINILKTRKKPKNFDRDRDKILQGFRNEFEKRIKNILNQPKFLRKKYHKENYQFRKLVFQKDGRKCKECGNKKELVIAHILPVELFPELAFEVWNGQVKCRDCHKKEPNVSFRKIIKDICNIEEVYEKLDSIL